MQGLPFVRNGKTLLSAVDPAGRAEQVAKAVPVKERTIYFCPSPLYGYGLSSFLSRLETEAPDCAVLCIEADPELFTLSMQNIDSSVASNKLFCLTNVCDNEGIYSLVREKWGARAFRRVEILRTTGGWQLFPEVYDSICDSLRREIATDWSNALTLSKMGRLYIRNALRNLPLVLKFPSVQNLSFGEAPILVLGAGPSLDETLNALETKNADVLACTEKRNFKIICVDTCLGALKERNIVPDLAVILESQHWNINDFLTCRGWKVNATIDLSSLPASVNILSGENFLFFTPWTKLKIFERLKSTELLPAVVPPLGSVGLTAVELARRLTTGKIICAGLDFSFTQDKYHARSTPGHRSRLNLQSRFKRLFNPVAYNQYSIAAVSKLGLPVYTNPAMKNYRDLFEQEFGGDSRIFDIESTGLPLGIKTLSLKDALALLEQDKLAPPQNVRVVRGKNSELNSFYKNEKNKLEELRSLLTGEKAADNERLNTLIEECDYLWAHFPDYAGGKRPSITDISFLKRLRAEIDPMLKLFIFSF
ncbi:6-hydroxymethylpterin diphosphokinase MptE-like protein [Treponema sp. R6D11]